ncbi:hypothetical protein BGZ94_007713, partial [Podila epigama]
KYRHRPSMGDNGCVPETSIKEYHPFYLKSFNLNTLVSKHRDHNLLVGGVSGDKNFEQLELCVVSSDLGCSSEIHSSCIYQNVGYRFHVNAPVKGYLRVSQDLVEIVDSFFDATPMTLYKEAGWGLRISQVFDDGNHIVFSARAKGAPIEMEEPVTNAARQWFEIVENDSKYDSKC